MTKVEQIVQPEASGEEKIEYRPWLDVMQQAIETSKMSDPSEEDLAHTEELKGMSAELYRQEHDETVNTEAMGLLETALTQGASEKRHTGSGDDGIEAQVHSLAVMQRLQELTERRDDKGRARQIDSRMQIVLSDGEMGSDSSGPLTGGQIDLRYSQGMFRGKAKDSPLWGELERAYQDGQNPLEKQREKAVQNATKFYNDRAEEAMRQAEERPEHAKYFEAKAGYYRIYAAIAERNARARFDQEHGSAKKAA